MLCLWIYFDFYTLTYLLINIVVLPITMHIYLLQTFNSLRSLKVFTKY